MNGTLYAAMEIVVFICAATTIGFLMGRAISRPKQPRSPQEAAFLRTRVEALETKYLLLLGERDGLVVKIALQAAESRAKAERVGEPLPTAESFDEPSIEAPAGQDAGAIESLREELALVTEEIDRLRGIESESSKLEGVVARRDAEIGRLEGALQTIRDREAGMDSLLNVPGDHARTGGSGLVTDALIAPPD